MSKSQISFFPALDFVIWLPKNESRKGNQIFASNPISTPPYDATTIPLLVSYVFFSMNLCAIKSPKKEIEKPLIVLSKSYWVNKGYDCKSEP